MRDRIKDQTGYVLDLLYILLLFTLLVFFLKMVWYMTYTPVYYDTAASVGLAGFNIIARLIFSVLILVTRIFLVFYFVRWSYLAYSYLSKRDELYYLTHAPSTAVWSWFVPVLNLFMPFLIVREIYEAMHDIVKDGEMRISSWLLPLWWGLFLASVFSGFFLASSSVASLITDPVNMTGGWLSYIVIMSIKIGSLITSVVLFRRLKKLAQLLSVM